MGRSALRKGDEEGAVHSLFWGVTLLPCAWIKYVDLAGHGRVAAGASGVRLGSLGEDGGGRERKLIGQRLVGGQTILAGRIAVRGTGMCRVLVSWK